MSHTSTKKSLKKYQGFSKSDLKQIYSTIALSQNLDKKMLILLKQGKSFFHIGSAGHGAVQVAAAMNLTPQKDWSFPYYRDLAFCLQMGMTPEEALLGALAKAGDPGSGARQMPQHYGHKDLRIPTQSSPTGTQFLQAAGLAMGIRKDGRDEVVYVSAGEGTTSQGDFHEALNWCAREKLPVVFHIEDNHYAISVPVSEQTAGGSVYSVVEGYQNLERYRVDGTHFFDSYQVFKKAVARTRSGAGPCVVISDVIRLLSHSASDDHHKYRTKEELEEDRQRDPVLRFQRHCIEEGILTANDFETLDEQVHNTIETASEWALAQPDPEGSTALDHVYAPERETVTVSKPRVSVDPIMLVDAINHGLREEMAKNDRMLIYGEDVAGGKGGVFTVTRGLTDLYGKDRVFNSPLAESSIVGTAVGLALYGYKPVIEIQFGDYIWPGMHQICNEVATFRYRSNGQFTCPMVIRVPVGGYIHGGVYHSQSIEATFTHIPGLRVVFPSNAGDAKALLKTAIQSDDPVLFLEHKALYRSSAAATPEPPDDYYLPLGQARIAQKGDDLTVITWGMMVKYCTDAVRLLSEWNPSIEIVDLRSLNPLDTDTILQSIKKTGKALIVHEDNLFSGFGGEVAATIAEEAFEFLDGPIMRIGAADAHIPYHPNLEEQVLPQVATIAEKMKKLLLY